MTERFLIVLLMLVGASISDLRTRRVRNQFWWPFVAAAAVFWGADLATGRDVRYAAAGAAAMTGLAYLLWRFGAFGGADAKGLMVFAWLWPGVPDLLAARTLPVLDTLANAALIAIVLPLAFLVANAARRDLRFPAALLGLRMQVATAEGRHVWPMQRLRPPAIEAASESPLSTRDLPTTPELRWRYWQRPGESLQDAYAALRHAGVDRVWVTPKIPFMVPLAVAAAATWAWGNLLLVAMLRA